MHIKRKIDEIIIHNSKTKADVDIGVAEIRRWHKARGYLDIGYHYVIKRDGTIEEGRSLEEAGAYATGRNAHSIGVCIVGGINDEGKPEVNYTTAQYVSITQLLEQISKTIGAGLKVDSTDAGI